VEIFAIISRKLCKIAPNFACFGPKTFLGESPPPFLDLHYKTSANTDHSAKFRGDRLTELRDLVAK